MKQFFITGYLVVTSLLIYGCKEAKAGTIVNKSDNQVESATVKTIDEPDESSYPEPSVKDQTKIQVAILLDTSSSMDGLIEQAKSRLWNIINTMTTLKFKGKEPVIEIALYEYGNNNIRNDDYIRQVMPLSTDLDMISQKLFALTTLGGAEYCGAVIDKATKNLNWNTNKSDIRLIYIAGNEPFTQGYINYIEAIQNALGKNIYVNTIHCGDAEEGIRGMWHDGAAKGKGKFFNINHNARVRYIETPFDDKISQCNKRLNDTYYAYGSQGAERKQNQMVQDQNAKRISSSNQIERAVSKSKSVYNNTSWDLIDLAKEDANALDTLQKADLPEELQHKTKKELQEFLLEKEAERKQIRHEIEILAGQRQAYIDEEMKKIGETGDDLGKAITQSVLEVALAKGYTTE